MRSPTSSVPVPQPPSAALILVASPASLLWRRRAPVAVLVVSVAAAIFRCSGWSTAPS